MCNLLEYKDTFVNPSIASVKLIYNFFSLLLKIQNTFMYAIIYLLNFGILKTDLKAFNNYIKVVILNMMHTNILIVVMF